MKFIELAAEKRDKVGKGISRTLRSEKRIPGVIYGKNTEAVNVSVLSKDLEKAIKATDTMEVFIKLEVGSESYQAMLKELQVDILNGKYIHADFLTIENDQVLDFKVPIEVVGEEDCAGIADGGILQIVRRELDLRCTVDSMPESIKVDISELGLGESVHIEDLDLGEGIEIFTDVNFTVVNVVAPATEDSSDEEDEDGEVAADSEGAE